MRKLLRRLVTVVGIGSRFVVGPPVTVLAATSDDRHEAADALAAQVALVLGAGIRASLSRQSSRVVTGWGAGGGGSCERLAGSGTSERQRASGSPRAGTPAVRLSSCRSIPLSGVVVVSQAFHLPRAVWLCGRAGLTAHGAVAGDVGATSTARYGWLREVPAVDKSVLDVLRRRTPTFPGPREDAFDHITGAAGRP